MPLALKLKKLEGKPGQVYYPLELSEVPRPKPGPRQVLVRIQTAALNHRDLFIRQHLYPNIALDRPMLADGYGTVVEIGPDCSRARQWLRRPVLLLPARGWDSDPDGPEDLRGYSPLGSSKNSLIGTAQEFVAVGEEEVELAPEHLRPEEGAALPLVGLTAWRAFVTKSGNAVPGRNVLITGIGGGVALQALQFAVAMGCRVFVTSSDESKISRAKELGAANGVSYRQDDWDKQLQRQLPKSRPYLDAVLDGAGGDIVAKTVRLLKAGGIIVSYGMTLSPSMDWTVQAMLKNIEIRGSTMGSRREFRDMVHFVSESKIRPVVSKVVSGLRDLDAVEALFEVMRDGKQFGKLVLQIADPEPDSRPPPKL